MTDMPPQDSWTIEVNGTEYGPYTHYELQCLQAEGRVDCDIMGYDETVGEWRRLADIVALRTLFAGSSRR